MSQSNEWMPKMLGAVDAMDAVAFANCFTEKASMTYGNGPTMRWSPCHSELHPGLLRGDRWNPAPDRQALGCRGRYVVPGRVHLHPQGSQGGHLPVHDPLAARGRQGRQLSGVHGRGTCVRSTGPPWVVSRTSDRRRGRGFIGGRRVPGLRGRCGIGGAPAPRSRHPLHQLRPAEFAVAQLGREGPRVSRSARALAVRSSRLRSSSWAIAVSSSRGTSGRMDVRAGIGWLRASRIRSAGSLLPE